MASAELRLQGLVVVEVVMVEEVVMVLITMSKAAFSDEFHGK